jgi:biopolymer transport protein ExbB/TolQ
MNFNLIDLLYKAKFVAWPLGACSILAVAIVLERLFSLWKIRQQEDSAFAIIRPAVENGADYRADDPAVAGAPITHIMDTLSSLRGATEESLWQAAEIALSLQRMRLRRFMNALATIGSIAPFIGLFGTVLGVMHSFETMKVGGLSSERITGDIAEALAATALGLLVAIPAVVAYNFLLGQVQSSLLHVQSHVSRIIPHLRGLNHAAPARQKQEV